MVLKRNTKWGIYFELNSELWFFQYINQKFCHNKDSQSTHWIWNDQNKEYCECCGQKLPIHLIPILQLQRLKGV